MLCCLWGSAMSRAARILDLGVRCLPTKHLCVCCVWWCPKHLYVFVCLLCVVVSETFICVPVFLVCGGVRNICMCSCVCCVWWCPKHLYVFVCLLFVVVFGTFLCVQTHRWTYSCSFRTPAEVRGCIQKFPDRVDNEINNNKNKHTLRSKTKSYDGKTH
jgi:hypothetical protein